MSQAGYARYWATVSVQSRLNKGMVERVRHQGRRRWDNTKLGLTPKPYPFCLTTDSNYVEYIFYTDHQFNLGQLRTCLTKHRISTPNIQTNDRTAWCHSSDDALNILIMWQMDCTHVIMLSIYTTPSQSCAEHGWMKFRTTCSWSRRLSATFLIITSLGCLAKNCSGKEMPELYSDQRNQGFKDHLRTVTSSLTTHMFYAYRDDIFARLMITREKQILAKAIAIQKKHWR